MIISDGSTSLTLTSQEDNNDSEIIKSQKISADGSLKNKTAGERFFTNEVVRVSGDQFRSLMDLITNNADEYFYTPDVIPPDWDSSDFPMSVTVDYAGKSTRAVGDVNGTFLKLFYISLDIRSNTLFNQ